MLWISDSQKDVVEIFDLCVKELKKEQYFKNVFVLKGCEYRSNIRVKISLCIYDMTVHC